MPARVAVIMAVYNRCEMTRIVLDALSRQRGLGEQFTLEAWVLDDGSTDDTQKVLGIERDFPVHCLTSEQELYWARGMKEAETAARATNPDFILWVNNDVGLVDDAVKRVLDVCRGHERPAIVVGATREALLTPAVTSYSGWRKKSRRPGNLSLIDPLPDTPLCADTCNGNFVLSAANVVNRLDGIDGGFEHGLADWDYGLRAQSEGIDVIIAPGYVGVCNRNSETGTWRDVAHTRVDRIRLLLGPKGLPIRGHARFIFRHAGFIAPIYFLAAYASAVFEIMRKPTRGMR